MPELPEVETTRLGIEPWLINQTIKKVNIFNSRLRWPIPAKLTCLLPGNVVQRVERRAKYLLIFIANGCLILHLGMSGSLRISHKKMPYKKHDHFELLLSSDQAMRLHDPRRFGSVLWTEGNPLQHPLLKSLGPEPLEEAFNADYFYASCRNKKASIKQHIMNNKVVVGVGNIYASESLFLAGIHPKRAAGKISKARTNLLHGSIVEILKNAIQQGGTTLRDFTQSDGNPGYFAQKLCVYGKVNSPCPTCTTAIRHITLGQRSTYYCPKCQH